jgi:outer membrane lipoprotein-sorting protein
MTRYIAALTFVTIGFCNPAKADDPKVLIDRAIKAMGGQEKLESIHAVQAKTKGTINIGGTESPMNGQLTGQGFDHYRLEFEGEFGGGKIKGVTVINGKKGWRKLNDEVAALDEEAMRGEKQTVYIQLAVGNPTVLKGKEFKVSKAEKSTITVTGPDGKEFSIEFDKDSGLPIKVVAKVLGFGGEEVQQETTYSAYKDFGGIRKATKTESKRDGEPFLKSELIDFKALDKVDPKTFDEPK